MTKVKEYNNGEVTVLWKPELCYHSTICVKGLPEVFRPKEKPWIKVDAATSEAIINQVHKCPSGALSMKAEENKREAADKNASIEVKVIKNGPLMVSGPMIIQKEGAENMEQNQAAFCRCGASGNKPFCDGSHNNSDFEG